MAVVNRIEAALADFKERRGGVPAALYVEPITKANTDFGDLEEYGIPVKVSLACQIGRYYLVTEEEDVELQEWERARAAKAKEELGKLAGGGELSGGE